MKRVATVTRVLLGIAFVVLGANGFLAFLPNPPSFPEHAMQFLTLVTVTHFGYLIFGAQLLCGVLLLVNRFTGFAIVTLAAVLANVLAFHVTMWPETLLPMPIVVLVLWFLTAWPLRRPLVAAMTARI